MIVPLSRSRGFSFVETLVATAVFLLMSVAIYQTYQGLLALVSLTRAKTIAAALSNEIFEIAHNLPYADVGVPQGVPSGKLPHTQTISRDGISFLATTTVRTIDDPFDGTIGGSPNDTAPSDYKLVEVEIGCPTCRFFQPLVVSGRIAPKNLEGASTNGALFIRVFDA
ncbi:MAG: prepilin-type N-terminal cleavage/methylation domain-containing protein, partial [Patescibacteria group bacterium]